MPGFVRGKKRITEPNMCLTSPDKQDILIHSKGNPHSSSQATKELESTLLPRLPDDVVKYCLALVPRSSFPAMGGVCKRWRSFIQSKGFLTERRIAGMLEEWLYVLTMDSEGKESHWEVLDCLGRKHHLLPPMPGPAKVGFGVAVPNGKLLVMAGFLVINGTASASADVYQYDSCLNSLHPFELTTTDNMNGPPFLLTLGNTLPLPPPCLTHVIGVVYVVGGYGIEGESLSTAEVSSFTIGNSRFVDVYNPEKHTWCEMKNGCVMVTAHAVLEKKLFCMEWKNQRKLAIFNPEDNSWKMVPVPLTGSTSIGFRFGILDGKLLLLSVDGDPCYNTLLYDPNASPGSEWQTSDIKPSERDFLVRDWDIEKGCTRRIRTHVLFQV
ncbi:hypothetical protein CRYUN_Cryun04dG0161700 [Craigia yunnanensis]